MVRHFDQLIIITITIIYVTFSQPLSGTLITQITFKLRNRSEQIGAMADPYLNTYKYDLFTAVILEEFTVQMHI